MGGKRGQPMELVMSIQPVVARHLSEDGSSSFARDVIDGLTARPKRLSTKYFYDETGSRLFGQMTVLPEHDPRRCDDEILCAHPAYLTRPRSSDSALIA